MNLAPPRHPLPALPAVLLLAATTAMAQTAPSSSTRVADETPVTLDVFTVQENPARAYGSNNLASATRLNTPAENVPQSISVINEQLLLDIGAVSYEQAVRYTPGVTQRQNVQNGSVIRGFIVSNRYRNGFLVPGFESDLINLDRIEIIKGPSASIAGSSESGGYVNFITKKPQFKEAYTASATFGSRGFMRGTIDATGPIEGLDLAYRLNAVHLTTDSWRDNEKTRKTAVYPSFLWKISSKTQLSVDLEYFDGLAPSGFSTPYIAPVNTVNQTGTTSTSQAVVIPPGVVPKFGLGQWASMTINSSGEPGMGQRSELYSAFITLSHQFNDIFAARQAVSYFEADSNRYLSSVANFFAYNNNGEIIFERNATRNVGKSEILRAQGDLVATKKWFDNDLGATVLVGYDIGRSDSWNTTSTAQMEAFNINSPVYGQPFRTPMTKTVDNTGKGGNFGYFANAQISGFDDRIVLTGGMRRDQGKASWTRNNFTNVYNNVAKTPVVESPMYGLTVKPLKWLALYAVSSEAGAASRQVAIFPNIPLTDPRQILQTVTPLTTNDEFGLKASFLDGAFAVNLAHYEIVQVDNVRNNTSNDIINVPGGSQNIIESGNTAKGWELEFSGSLTRTLSLVGGYAYTETQAPGFKEDGKSPREIRGMPKHKFQAFARYDFTGARANGFSVRAGIVTQTAVWGIAENTYRVAGATRWDVGLNYRRNNWDFSLTCENLTNVIFPQSTIAPGSNTVDAPRTVYFGTTWKY
ncbi:MAG TPA: TonB-dependent receptor [Opitutaceae bacterium]|nr:TonB-dependent receptor [Opitutaceae bacterium]